MSELEAKTLAACQAGKIFTDEERAQQWLANVNQILTDLRRSHLYIVLVKLLIIVSAKSISDKLGLWPRFF